MESLAAQFRCIRSQEFKVSLVNQLTPIELVA